MGYAEAGRSIGAGAASWWWAVVCGVCVCILPPCGESGKGGRSQSWAGMGSCPWAAAVPRKRSGARTCQTLCVWLKCWTTDTCEDREKEGRKRKERKRLSLLLCTEYVSVSVCLPTNTLSSPFPPSLAPSLEFSSIQSSPVHHKLRATQLFPHLSSSSSSFSEPTTAKLWTLVSEICTSVQSTSSDYRCKWVCLPLPAASRSTYPAVLRHPTAAEKGGIADRLFGAGDKTLATLARL